MVSRHGIETCSAALKLPNVDDQGLVRGRKKGNSDLHLSQAFCPLVPTWVKWHNLQGSCDLINDAACET